ncbi:hypothetical protein ABZY03_17570 [Streptomyces klenkii]|uniref:hypothetical protein n=1 Tax=Streptomyces klenkii TaxID=1420899 RepID=UPI0033A0AE89
MADDHRYDWLEDWLDDDAVERLLNGSPAAGPARGSAAADQDAMTGPADGGARTKEKADGDEGESAVREGLSVRESSAVRDSSDGDGPSVGDGSVAGTSPDGAPVPAEADRLVAALRELVPPPAADGVPLSGEEAALAAFREARAVAATETTSAAPEPSVRLGAPAAPASAPASSSSFARRFFPRWQPVKAALAMALAGCAIGGVAVAAGAGVLPAPFGRASGEPAAAPSVSAFGDDPATGVSPDGRRVPGASPSRGRDGSPSGSGTPDGSGSSAPGAGRSREPGDKNEPGDSPSASPSPGRSKGGDKDDSGRNDGAKPGTAWAVRMCRDYLDAQQRRGKAVDEDDVRTLERSFGIGDAVDLRASCERLVKADDAAKGSGGLTGGRTGTGKGGAGGGPDGVFRLVPPVRSSTGFGAPAPGVTFSDSAAL